MKKQVSRFFWEEIGSPLCGCLNQRGVSVMYQLRPSDPTSAGEKQANNATTERKKTKREKTDLLFRATRFETAENRRKKKLNIFHLLVRVTY